MSEFITDDYRNSVGKAINKHAEYLAAGKAESIERYREVVGKISGLKDSLAIYTQCIKKMHGDEDDD